MGGALSFVFNGFHLSKTATWQGRIAGTAIGAVGGAIVGNIAKDILIIGDPRIVMYGSLILGAGLGYMFLSDVLGVAQQVTRLSAD